MNKFMSSRVACLKEFKVYLSYKAYRAKIV